MGKGTPHRKKISKKRDILMALELKGISTPKNANTDELLDILKKRLPRTHKEITNRFK